MARVLFTFVYCYSVFSDHQSWDIPNCAWHFSSFAEESCWGLNKSQHQSDNIFYLGLTKEEQDIHIKLQNKIRNLMIESRHSMSWHHFVSHSEKLEQTNTFVRLTCFYSHLVSICFSFKMRNFNPLGHLGRCSTHWGTPVCSMPWVPRQQLGAQWGFAVLPGV